MLEAMAIPCPKCNRIVDQQELGRSERQSAVPDLPELWVETIVLLVQCPHCGEPALVSKRSVISTNETDSQPGEWTLEWPLPGSRGE